MKKFSNDNNDIYLNSSSNKIVDNVFYLYDSIDDSTGLLFSSYLDSVHADKEVLKNLFKIKINSSGGMLTSAIAIINEMMQQKANCRVDIICLAYSSAALIAMASKHIRISKLGLIMLHYPLWETEEESFNKHKELINITEEGFDRLLSTLLRYRHAKFTLKTLKKELDKGDFYITPKDALKYKLVDRVY